MAPDRVDGTPDLTVVGAGVIGMTIAWRAAVAGLRVEVRERETEPGHGTSAAAAGMLAPVAEAEAQEPQLLAANLASARRWPQFADELAAAADYDVHLRTDGTLLVARDAAEAAWLERERDLRERLGLDTERLLGSEARRCESALSPSLRLAVAVGGDHAVEPARVVHALRVALGRAGVPVRCGDEIGDPSRLPGRHVVIAAGVWAAALAGTRLTPPPVRPVKGQALRLRDPRGPGLIERVLRWGVPSPGYLVPRGDGRYYLGATVEERGFETTSSAWAIRDLLRYGAEIVPGILELEIDELVTGLRPGTPDNVPIIGRDPRDERVIWATGHYRNGILLAPLTAELVLASAGAVPPPADLDLPMDVFSPARTTTPTPPKGDDR